MQEAPEHGLCVRQPKAEGSSNHSGQARKDMVPPLSTSWPWLRARSAPQIPGSWGKCSVGAKLLRQEPLGWLPGWLGPPHRRLVLWGPSGRLGWFFSGGKRAAFVKRDSMCLPSQRTTDEEADTEELWRGFLFPRPHMELHTQAGHVSFQAQPQGALTSYKTMNPNSRTRGQYF